MVVAAALGDMISPVVVGNVSNMRWFVTFVQHKLHRPRVRFDILSVIAFYHKVPAAQYMYTCTCT